MTGSSLRRMRIMLAFCMLMPMIAMAAGDAPMCHAMTGAQRGALVELYTSEGCSSCPPADRWFAQLARDANPVRLSLLAFHVDYWDSIGWPDRFGSAMFSARQQQRVANAGSESVYTPQVMLGQRVGLRWGTPSAISAVNAMAAQASPFALDLAVTPNASGLDVNLRALPIAGGSIPNGALYLALYENGLSTQVRAGENNGILLHHEHVVRQLQGPFQLGGTQWSRVLHLVPPLDAHAGRLGLTAFVQSGSGDTLQALSLPLGACVH